MAPQPASTPVPSGPILVTGGAGYVGSHAVRMLHRAGVSLAVLDNLSAGHLSAVPKKVPFFKGDLLDADRLDEVFAEIRPRAILHFAARCYVGESVRDPEGYHLVNVEGTQRLLRAARKVEVKEFVFSSTCATYGVPLGLPINEDHPQNPISPYGETKLKVEHMLAAEEKEVGLRFACLRYFNAAGADPSGLHGEDHRPETHLIPLTLQVALGQREQLSVFGTDHDTRDGTCIRDYVHIDDLADAHLRALSLLQSGHESLACNLGTGEGVTVREVIAMARKVSGHPVPSLDTSAREGDPAGLISDGSRAITMLGWVPRRSDLRTLLEDAWRWHRKHPTGYRD
ncbi:MAG TPA: UDP-glucose 4-epimerase GalE [Planctomycetes bacterium]|nr:UDP-glucose 4-epimerase GalE [Planctomycetota bacterium]HIL38594.1 UDP-glucose 4-epimerase GalE [Planctomycetota bacterium]